MRVKSVKLLRPGYDDVCGTRSRALIELSEPIRSGRKRSPYVLVSHIERRPETPDVSEVMVFLAEEDGCVLDWDEINVAHGMGFPEALELVVDGLESL